MIHFYTNRKAVAFFLKFAFLFCAVLGKHYFYSFFCAKHENSIQKKALCIYLWYIHNCIALFDTWAHMFNNVVALCFGDETSDFISIFIITGGVVVGWVLVYLWCLLWLDWNAVLQVSKLAFSSWDPIIFLQQCFNWTTLKHTVISVYFI